MLKSHTRPIWILPVLHQPEGEGKKVWIRRAAEAWFIRVVAIELSSKAKLNGNSSQSEYRDVERIDQAKEEDSGED